MLDGTHLDPLCLKRSVVTCNFPSNTAISQAPAPPSGPSTFKVSHTQFCKQLNGNLVIQSSQLQSKPFEAADYGKSKARTSLAWTISLTA